MKVELISLTPDPVRCMYLGAARCRTSGSLEEYAKNGSGVMRTVVSTCIQSGHLTVAEMAEMTFDVQGVDLNTVMQYLRHRHFSTLQRSGRCVVIGEPDEVAVLREHADSPYDDKVRSIVDKYFVVPQQGVASAARAIIDYRDMVDSGVPVEEARRILPQGMRTDLIVHCNFRALIEASWLRLCNRAQKEIRELFDGFREALKRYSADGEWMSRFLQRKCEAFGRCNEDRSCGYADTRRGV